MSDPILKAKQTEIDRLIGICRKNNWPVPRTCGALIQSIEMANKLIGQLSLSVIERSNGKRMRDDGVYF